MSSIANTEFLRRRAHQSLEQAGRAQCAEVRRVQLELAQLYTERLDALSRSDNESA